MIFRLCSLYKLLLILFLSGYLRNIVSDPILQFYAGAMEPGVQGVQLLTHFLAPSLLHTHFLAPSFREDLLFSAKFG